MDRLRSAVSCRYNSIWPRGPVAAKRYVPTVSAIGAATPWDPWDASRPTLVDIVETKCIWSPQAFATGCHFFAGHLDICEAYSGSQHFLKERSKEEQERELVEHGWSNNRRRGRDGGEKGRESVYAQLGVHSNFSAFSAVFAPAVSASCGSRAATLTSGFNF